MDDISQTSPRISSPASPTFQNQQIPPSRSYNNLNSQRGQVSPFPSTSPSAMYSEPPPGMTYQEFLRTWSDNHVARWLADIKCGIHASTFKANDIRGDVLLELDQVTLKEMGITSIGDRLRIVNAVKALRQKSAVKVATPPPPDQDRAGAGDSRAAGLTREPARSDRPSHDRSASETSLGSRLAARRLEVGRPAPLQLNSNRGNDLPRLVRDSQGPDSARTNTTSVRPLPHPAQTTTNILSTPTSNASNTSTSTNNSNQSTTSTRSNLLVPPASRNQPPARVTPRALRDNTGRKTPTQADVPPYVTQPLPPAPQNQSLLTPNTSNSGNWTGSGYGLPSDPRPGNPGGKTPVRATSPLNLPPRSFPRATNPNALHGRHMSVSSPNAPPAAKLPVRPMTGNNSHPYATAQGPSLLPISSQQTYNLSPIAESFISQNPSTSGTPSPPTQAYTVGRGPFVRSSPYPNPPSLNDLRWKLVKFVLPDEGHTCTINVADCPGGVEVLEKVLKKVGKFGSRGSDADMLDHVQTNEGGLTVDGWGVYLDSSQGDRPGESMSLTLTRILS
jgi:mitogen-activated protein kinase kinase kinase